MQAVDNTIAREALTRNGMVIVAADIEEAREITNRLAPEHLTVDSSCGPEVGANAGSVFVGGFAAADGRLHLGAKPHSADGRHGAGARRAERK